MHLIQIIRNYLGLSQQELAQKAGITQPDLCEMEIKEPYGRIEKYQRLSEYLGIPVHALVTNDCRLVPLSFFDNHPGASYSNCRTGGNQGLGRAGEEAAFRKEVARLSEINPSLAKLVIPHFKLRNRPGYDILSFDQFGKPIYIEVKTSADDNSEFLLTKQELQKANKVVAEGDSYLIYRYTNWGTEHQCLTVFDFNDLREQYEFTPVTYACTSKRNSVISGIQHCREMRGMSKGELADCLGIKTPDLWRYENEKRRCPVGIYRKLASILDVTIDELLLNHKVVSS